MFFLELIFAYQSGFRKLHPTARVLKKNYDEFLKGFDAGNQWATSYNRSAMGFHPWTPRPIVYNIHEWCTTCFQTHIDSDPNLINARFQNHVISGSQLQALFYLNVASYANHNHCTGLCLLCGNAWICPIIVTSIHKLCSLSRDKSLFSSYWEIQELIIIHHFGILCEHGIKTEVL